MTQTHTKTFLAALAAVSCVGFANAGTIDSSSFNAVTNGAVVTTGALDWGYWSNDGGMFDGTYSAADYGTINDGGDPIVNYTTAEASPGIGNVTITEAPGGVSDGIAAQTNNSNYTFDGSAAFGSYGGFGKTEQDVWELTFNDLGVGTFSITLYMGHSATDRKFDMDITLSDGGPDLVSTTTMTNTIADLGSTVAAYDTTGVAFTYDITVTTTTADADLSLVFGSAGGNFGGAIFAGYTVVPEPGSLALLGLGGLLVASRRRRA